MRRRRAPGQFDSGGDEKALRQALHASLVEQRRSDVDTLPEAPAFRPTEEEWRDPLAYIASIAAAAESAGIARIVPPSGWRRTPFRNPVAGTGLVFETKRQELHRLQEGQPFGDVRGVSAGYAARLGSPRFRASTAGRELHGGGVRAAGARFPSTGAPRALRAGQCCVLTSSALVAKAAPSPRGRAGGPVP